jgi:peroxiredoxin
VKAGQHHEVHPETEIAKRRMTAMVLVASTMLELGTEAPHFELRDVTSGQAVTPRSARGSKGLLVMFICRHCPYVKHVEQELAQLGRDYADQGIGVVGISSNDSVGYPEDAPDSLKEQAEQVGFDFPYCFDETQEVAKAYTAACTPDLFLFDDELKLVYRGQLDDSRPGNNKPVTGQHLRAALDDVVAGRTVSIQQLPSAGCNIKWKPGSEPSYFQS